jgi:hypothetical protein
VSLSVDWHKARAILIAAFTLVNAFLAYQLWGGSARQAGSLVPSLPAQLQEVRDRLAVGDIQLAATIPTAVPPLTFLRVRRPETDSDALVGGFFGAQDRLVVRTEGNTVVARHGSEDLKLSPRGTLVYRNQGLSAGAGDGGFDRGAARQKAEEFLRERYPLPADARPDFAIPIGDGSRYKVEYFQQREGLPVFSGRISLIVSAAGVEQMSADWLILEGAGGASKKVIPATEALLRLAGHLEAEDEQGVIFESIQLGYYSPAYDAEEWDVPPVWRVRTATDETYYINAFTGELEG